VPKWLLLLYLSPSAAAQTNRLWHAETMTNYLSDMTWPEGESLRSRTDMVTCQSLPLNNTVRSCREGPTITAERNWPK